MSDKLVTNSIANSAVNSNVISSNTITNEKIANGALTAVKFASDVTSKFTASLKIQNLFYQGLYNFSDTLGNLSVNLQGSGFTPNSQVIVNKTRCTTTYQSQFSINFITPALPRGTYKVFVDNGDGTTGYFPLGILYIPLIKFLQEPGQLGNVIYSDNYYTIPINAEGDGTLVFTLETGTLPPGLGFNSNGVITGTPTTTAIGSYNFNASVYDNLQIKIYRDFFLTLQGGIRVINIYYNAPGQGNLSAVTTGGDSITLVGGPFVSGGNVVIGSAAARPFTFANSTTVSFTTIATTAGAYNLRLNNPNGTFAIRNSFITFRPPVTWITAAGALTGTTETATYNSNVSATSDGAITYSFISGALPLGLTFFSNGAISGTVTGGQIPAGQSTAYNFTVNAVCINGQNQTRSFSITVTAVPAIYNYTLPGVVTALNTIGGETVTVNGFNFSVGAVAVVNGINATTNRISNSQLTFTSPAISSGTYTIRVRNSDGALSNTTNVTYSIAPSWTTAQSLGNFFETQTYTSIQLIATSDSALTYTLASGSLPLGLSLSSTGFITGVLPLVVVETGYSFTVTVTDAEFQTNSRTFSMTVILGSKLLSLSPAIDGKSSWNLKTDGDLAFPSFGTYTLTSSSATFFVANVKVYGAGGGDMATNERSGGLGGYTTGVIGFEPGVSYTVIVGEGGDATLTSKFAGGGAGGTNSVNSRFNAGSGGGYSGLFYSTTVTQSTALLVAGGGGGGRGNRGGGGGGNSGETGESSYNVGGGGGTQAGPGAGGYFGPGEGTAGTSGSGSTGGTGGSTGGAGWAGGGGGGGGYYGGGGGPGGGGVGGAGGGGSGFVSANVSRVKFGYSITSQTIAGVHGGANQYPRSIYTGTGIQTFNGLVYITSNIVGVPTSVAVSSNLLPISYLVVGGGGGGGARIGGGGGAGGAIYGNVNLPMNTYPIIVGGGGAQKISSGSDSTFYIFTANGGGRGGTNTFLDATGPSTFGADGGSGGGGSGDNTANGQTGNPPGTGYNSRNGIAGKGNISKINFLQGNPGTTGYGLQSASPGAGGGGGGASTTAGVTDGVTGGTGGAGILWINGSYYAGGGGGGANSGGTAASGGVGGGGAGTSGSGAATSGTAFTGGGGGGGGAGGSTGGSGGSGVVIVAYSLATVIAANLGVTGGNIATLGNLTYHTFTTSGNLTITSYDRGVDLLLVAGGGGGGGAPVWGNNSNGGGGGAGGYRYIQKVYPTRSTVLTITVGAGGGGADGSTANPGSNGSDSSAFGLSATGGGGGGSYTPFNGITAGSSGGSGGGGGGAGGGQGRGGGGGNVGGYTPAEGNAGGSNWANDSSGASGGGGGAGAVGANGAPNAGGAGGAGLTNPFSEVSVGQFSGGVYYLAGGGGGAGATGGSGGLGGGGTANRTSGTQNIPSGLANTGGGGGGRGQGAGVGGTGGSGVVVIKELTTMYPAVTTGNVQVTTSGFYRFYTFYESGTIFLGEPSNIPDAFLYLAVAGGGGGGSSSISPLGGGGGGGGIAEGNVIIQKGASYTITVGAGGTASSNNTGSTYVAGSNGGNTSILSGAVGFGNIVAIGGGCGGSQTFAQGGFVGGSGGGAAGFSSVTTQTGASGITGGSGGTGVYQAGGGGGGASGATGGSGIFFNNKYTGGTGAAGKTITSLGPDSSDFRLGSPWQYAGGGGAGGSDLGGDGGAFASFGGGYGGRLLSPSQNDGNAGAAKSGGGGGGGLNGGNGGSGRVIIRTLLSVANATISGSVIYSQDAYYRSYAFDGTGTITWN